MRLTWIRAGLALLTAFAALPASAQDSPPPGPPEFNIDAGGWKGGAFGNPDTKQFEYCGISKQYDNGVLIFQINPAGNFIVGILKRDWNLAEGEKGPARIVIDDKFDQRFEAVPASTEVYVIPTGQNADLFSAIGRGNKATITLPKGEFSFPLTGTLAGLTALRSCIEKAQQLFAGQAGGGAAAGTPPEGTAGTPATPGTGDAASTAKVVGAQGFGMTVQDMLGLLNQAGFSGFGMADPARIRRDPLMLNQAWALDETGQVMGGLHQEPRGDDIEIDQFAKRYLEIMKAGCPVDWTQSDEPTTVMSAYAIKYAEASCNLNGQAIAVSLLFTLDDDYYSVFFHQSAPEHREEAVAATRKLGDFITGMMQGAIENATSPSVAPAAPATDAPATDAPATDAPATDAPATETPPVVPSLPETTTP